VRARFAIWAGLGLCTTALAAAATGGLARPAAAHRAVERPRVLVATSGNRSETRKTIPITRRSRATRRVVMSMRPRSLPDPKARDRLVVSAEFQVTLDCVKRVSSCAGRPYLFNARVGSQLVLARGRNAIGGRRAAPISARKRITCRGKPLSSRQHHCVIVFKHASFRVRRHAVLPCTPGSCRINLVVDAHSRRARRGNKLVIGNNRPTGRIGQDKGRINVIRLRPGSQPSPPREISRHRRRRRVPLNEHPTVIMSQRLTDLRRNEQLSVLARFKANVSHLPYSARVSSQLILARNPRATKPSPKVKRIATFDGEIDELNGANCTRVQTPCPYAKVGVMRMTHDARSRAGRPIPLYANLYVVSNPKRARRRPGDRLAILAHPKLEVARYRPSLRG
jgi:hypothetical protein